MDSKTETVSDNEAIAEFDSNMEWYIPKNTNYEPYWRRGGMEVKVKNMKYHTSWDWLMPVVEKIENIRYIGIDAIYIQIKGNTCQIWTYFDVKEFLRLTGDDKNDGNKFKVGHTAKTKIEAVYHSVVDFIKWFNSQSPDTIK